MVCSSQGAQAFTSSGVGGRFLSRPASALQRPAAPPRSLEPGLPGPAHPTPLRSRLTGGPVSGCPTGDSSPLPLSSSASSPLRFLLPTRLLSLLFLLAWDRVDRQRL